MNESSPEYAVYILEMQRDDEQRGIDASEARVARARTEIQREERYQNQARIHIQALNSAISNIKAQGSEAGNGND